MAPSSLTVAPSDPASAQLKHVKLPLGIDIGYAHLYLHKHEHQRPHPHQHQHNLALPARTLPSLPSLPSHLCSPLRRALNPLLTNIARHAITPPSYPSRLTPLLHLSTSALALEPALASTSTSPSTSFSSRSQLTSLPFHVASRLSTNTSSSHRPHPPTHHPPLLHDESPRCVTCAIPICGNLWSCLWREERSRIHISTGTLRPSTACNLSQPVPTPASSHKSSPEVNTCEMAAIQSQTRTWEGMHTGLTVMAC